MGPFLVALEHPPVGSLTDVLQADEQVLIQQLIARYAIEPLDVRVLIRLARLDGPDRHAGIPAYCMNASPSSGS